MEEYLEEFDILRGILANYEEKPTWNKLQCLFWNCYLLGMKVGRNLNQNDIQLFKGFDEDERETKPLNKTINSNKSKALTALLEIYKNGELTLDSKKEATRLVTNLRTFCQFNKLDFKFSQIGNKIVLKRSYCENT